MSHRILVIEDDPDLLVVVREILRDVGYEVVSVESIPAAVELLDRHDHALVLSDWPRFRGEPSWALVKSLIDRAAPVPVGFMTGLHVDESKAIALGAAFALRKPFGIDVLLAAVGRHVASELPAGHEQLVHRYFASLSSGNWDAVVDLCRDDVEYRLPGESPLSTVVRGRCAFRAFTEATFREFPEARFSVDQVLPGPSGAIGRYRSTWKNHPEPVPGSVLFSIDAGRIVRLDVRTDVGRLIP